jgi:hypothetical protein
VKLAPMTGPFDFQRFLDAQEPVYPQVLAELLAATGFNRTAKAGPKNTGPARALDRHAPHLPSS